MCLRHNYSDCCLATEPVLEPCPTARPPDRSSSCKRTFYLAVRTLQYANFWEGKGTGTGAGGMDARLYPFLGVSALLLFPNALIFHSPRAL